MDKTAEMAEAWSSALKKTQDALEKRRVTHDLVARRIAQGLNAKEIKPHFDGSPTGSGGWSYSRPLIAHHIRLGWAKLAAQLLEMEPAQKHEFPDETGKPQQIGALFCDTERAARLIWLLEQAEKRGKEKEGKCKPKP